MVHKECAKLVVFLWTQANSYTKPVGRVAHLHGVNCPLLLGNRKLPSPFKRFGLLVEALNVGKIKICNMLDEQLGAGGNKKVCNLRIASPEPLPFAGSQ